MHARDHEAPAETGSTVQQTAATPKYLALATMESLPRGAQAMATLQVGRLRAGTVTDFYLAPTSQLNCAVGPNAVATHRGRE